MPESLRRRVGRLETTASPVVDIGGILERGRKAVRRLTPAQIEDSRRARLVEMRRRHADHPYRGTALKLLQALERVSQPVTHGEL